MLQPPLGLSSNFFSLSIRYPRAEHSVAIDQALILAAGRGVRMGPRGQNVPKGFIELDGVSLAARSLSLLARAGVKEVTIVTGHLAEFYERLAPPDGLALTRLHNPLFATRGSFESLRAGLTAMRGSFLLLESDIVYEPRALDVVLASRHENLILTSGPTGAGDEVYVWADAQEGFHRFRGMSKIRAAHADAPFGELVGITKVSAELAAELAAHAVDGKPDADYESAVVRASSRIPIACHRVDDLTWGEIDDEAMLARVKAHLWPRLKHIG